MNNYTIKETKLCACGTEIIILSHRGPRDRCKKCIRKAAQVKFKATHPTRKLEINRQWSANNREKDRAMKRAWEKKQGRGYYTHKAALYRRGKERATPAWANLDKIREIYDNCPPGYHVDHIIPLNGKFVSGLHIETNLQYLSPFENRSKSNKVPRELVEIY